jgi:BirA family transcriptional regulator, biotin operon repressor / biotin---[acetyl-CoA-carboxylase] ligase
VSDPPGRATDTDTAAGRARIGRPRVHLRRIGSTNERARELAFAGAPHGTLVTAGEQTAGRGRQGRRWSAPAGSALLMSLLLRSPPPLLPLLAAVAVCDVAGEQARIKWPNDIVIESPAAGAGAATGLAKLAGILIEGRPQEGWAALGIGLNVAVRLQELPPELRPLPPEPHPAAPGAGRPAAGGDRRGAGLPAATLGLAPAQIETVLARLLLALAQRLAEPADTTLRAWRERDALRGREIVWAQGRGRAAGIDGSGRLVVVVGDGARTALSAGEVHLREIL